MYLNEVTYFVVRRPEINAIVRRPRRFIHSDRIKNFSNTPSGNEFG